MPRQEKIFQYNTTNRGGFNRSNVKLLVGRGFSDIIIEEGASKSIPHGAEYFTEKKKSRSTLFAITKRHRS